MSKISENLKNFINKHKELISQGNWYELFEEGIYELSKWERADLALMLKDSGIHIFIEDVFNPDYNYTDYIEEEFTGNISTEVIKQLNKDLDLDYSGDLKGYSFNEVLKALSEEHFFNPELKDYYRNYKDDSSPVTEFKYVILKPNSGNVGSLIGFGLIIKSKDNNWVKVLTNGLRESLIDWREGFGIGYNKRTLNKYVEEKHFEPLLRRLG